MHDRPHDHPSAVRPPVLTAAAVVLFVAGGLNAISGLFLLTLGGAGILFALFSFAVAAAAIYGGIHVFGLRSIGRTVGLVVAGLGVAVNLYVLIAQRNLFVIIGLALYGFVAWALLTNDEAFHP